MSVILFGFIPFETAGAEDMQSMSTTKATARGGACKPVLAAATLRSGQHGRPEPTTIAGGEAAAHKVSVVGFLTIFLA